MFIKAASLASTLLALSSSASAAAVKGRQINVPPVVVPGVVSTPNITILPNGSLIDVGPTNITLLNISVPGINIKKRSPLTITIPLNDIPVIINPLNTAVNLPNLTINLGPDNTGIIIGQGGLFTPILNLTIGGQPVGPSASAVNATLGRGGQDRCVYAIDGTFDAVSDLVTGGTNANVFNDVCLCLGTVPGFIQSSQQAVAISNDQGLSNVTALLDILVTTDPASEVCSFPPHATPACIFNDPCSFTCLPGYQKIGDVCARSDTDPVTCSQGFTLAVDGTCTCDAPSMIYNGYCNAQATNEAPTRRRRSYWF